MRRARQVVAVCVVTMCSLTLLVMMLAFFGYPHTTWRLLRRFLWILGLSELCAAGLGFALGRFAVSALTADLGPQQARLRLYLSETGHELRTPLTVMHGSVEILRKAAPAGDLVALALLDGLAQEIVRLLDLVQKVLLLARLDVVRSAVMRPVDIGRVLKDLAAWARERSASTPVTLNFEPGLSAVVDEAGFAEAIRNLIVNALQYAPGAAICIEAKREGLETVVSVGDDGPGIDAEDAALAFERYYRGAGAVNVVGAGLGLSIVQALAERHGGSATIQTAPGSGVIVTIRMRTSP